MKLPRVIINAQPVSLIGLPQTYMERFELAALVHMVQAVKPEAMMEIGVNTGRTAALLLRNVPSLQRYVGVDVWPGYQFDKRVQMREVPAEPGLHARGDPRFTALLSTHGSKSIQPQDIGNFDVVFIDGDHSEAAVRSDTALARKVVRPGGMIIWHDYHDKETVDVRKVLDEEFEDGRVIQAVENTWLAFEHR